MFKCRSIIVLGVVAGLIFFQSARLVGLEYGIAAKAEGLLPLKTYALFAERCSGSNYTEQLILNNTYLELKTPWHKHFMPWFDLPAMYPEDPRNSHFKLYEDTLFIVVFRDPYDWARSLHFRPHQAAPSLQRVNFGKFIRSVWTLDENAKSVKLIREINPLADCNPSTKLPFKNIFAMRTCKIKDQLRLRDMVKNIYYVNYETVRDYPGEVLKEISKLYEIDLKPIFQPTIEYKGDKTKHVFEQKKYAPISKKDMIYINSQLDVNIEKQVGTKLRLISDEE